MMCQVSPYHVLVERALESALSQFRELHLQRPDEQIVILTKIRIHL